MVKVNLYCAILFIPGLLFGMNSFSQQAAISNTSPKASFGFIENKGQIHDQDYKPNPTVKYLLILNNGLNVQLKDNSFSYDTYIFERTKKEKEEEEPDILRHPFDSVDNYDNTYHFHRIDIELLNANPNPEIIAEGASEDYLNYYNAVTPEEGATGIRSYQKVTYKDMYPGIDLEFVAKPATEKPVEYNFIIHPGADGSRIRLKYRGAIETQLAENQIKIRVAQGWLYESIPASMVKEDNQNLAVKYKAFGQNEFGLQIPEYDPFKTLFIDPMPGLDWGTYYGGNIQDYGKALSIDKSKNIYVVGYTNSTSSMATSGVHQDSFGGGNEDVFIAKLTNKGQRIWGTYYGGSGSDIGNDIVLDGNENILITGSTASNWAIATFGTHQANYGGGYCDAFVGKFSTSGKRIWASYLGGSEGDYGNSICADVNDYVIITGHTRSSKSIASNGAFQTTYSGFNDAFVAKFSKNGQRQWGTYFGGSAWDVSNAIATDKSGNTYIAGITKSSSGIATSGAYKSTSSGSYDGFIAKFNASGQRIWGTYYGGWGDEIITAITLDIHGDVLFSGHDYYNAFLAKFKASGQIKWATNYGSGTTDSRSIRCDDIGNVFITGSTGSSINIASAAAYQKVLHGNCDAYVAKFNSNGQFVWGTYYGGYLSENANDVDVYGHGKVIIAGYTNSTSNIAITNVHQLNKSGYNDAFVAQFSGCNPSCDSLTIYACDSFDFNGTVLFKPGIYYDTLANYENCDSIIKLFLYFHAHPRADFTVHDSMQCLSDNVFYFSNQSSIDSGNYSSFWSFGDHENSLSVSPAHSFPHADTFFVRLTTVSDSGCSDWIEKKAIVHPLPLAAFFVNDSVQCQEKNNFIFTNTSTSVDSLKSYFWEFGDGDSSGQVNPVHTYGYIDTFQVRLIASSLFDCVDTFESFVYVADPVLGVQIGINDALQCMENNVFQFTNTSSIQNGTFTSHWDFGDGLSSTDQNPKHSYGTDDTFEVKLMVTTQEGCRDSTLAKVYVFPMPLAAFSVKDSQQCVKDNLFEFANFSSIPYGYNSYTWLFGDGNGSTQFFPTHHYQQAGVFYVTLEAKSKQGCTDSITKQITVYSSPITAFSINDSTQCLDSNSFDFTNLSVISEGVISNRWIIDSMQLSIFQPSNFQFKRWGKFPVKLITTSDHNCTDTSEQNMYVFPMPVAAFIYLNNCLEDTMWFYDSSMVDSGKITQWFWDFKNGNTSANKNPFTIYYDTGQKSVTLVSTSDFGCATDTTRFFTIESKVTAPILERATVENDEHILVEWKKPMEGIPMTYHLERSDDGAWWDYLSDEDQATFNYEDYMVYPDERSYYYRLKATDSCDFTGDYSNYGKSILLRVDTSGAYPRLSWPDYEEWSQGVAAYELQVKSIKSKGQSGDEYTPVAVISQSEIPNPQPGISCVDSMTNIQAASYCYRVIAYRNEDSLQSVSNVLCIPAEFRLFVPNSFTPNGDGINDIFLPKGIFVSAYNVQIFNRWGEKVFESDDMNVGWDGKFKGEICPVGVYYYHLSAKGPNGGGKGQAGSVMLLR